MKSCQEEIVFSGGDREGAEGREPQGRTSLPVDTSVSSPVHPGNRMFEGHLPHLRWIKDGGVPVNLEFHEQHLEEIKVHLNKIDHYH